MHTTGSPTTSTPTSSFQGDEPRTPPRNPMLFPAFDPQWCTPGAEPRPTPSPCGKALNAIWFDSPTAPYPQFCSFTGSPVPPTKGCQRQDVDWEVELVMPRKPPRGLIDVEEEGGDGMPPPEVKGNTEPPSTPPGPPKPEEADNYKPPEEQLDPTRTRAVNLNDLVHSQSTSGNESSTSAYNPMNRPFPTMMGQLCQYLADGVSVTRLFPHDRVGKDGRRCRATHIRKGDTWAVIPQCNEPCKSMDNYARHVKTVHLRGFECVGGVRGSVSIVDWLNNVFGFRVSKITTNMAIKVIHPPAGLPIM